MRFQSTPRFGSTQSATRQMEDVEEIDAATSQSQSQSSATEQPRSDGRDIASDSIEVDSYADSLASQGELRSSGSSEHETDEDESGDERRQRGYVSDVNEDAEDEGLGAPAQNMYEDAGSPPPVKRRRLSASASPTRQHMVTAYGSNAGHYETHSGSEQEYEEHDVQDKTRTRASAQQPTFQPAPRFKAPEDELPGHDQGGPTCALIAAPFSPQRRGARYVPGGLAAQLQGLLSQIKGSETLGGAGDGAVVRLSVDEIGLGTRMHLVQGRLLSRGAEAEHEGVVRRYILAGGEGGGGALVKEGSVLRIMAAPAWEVHLGEEWTVACEWCVESLEG